MAYKMENFYQIAFLLLSSTGGAAIIVFALSSWLGKVWANRILESDKSKYTKELDKIRHQFEIERNQLSIIHNNQKISFQRVIKSLQKSIKALEQGYDQPWQPIPAKFYNELNEIVIEESLFLGAEGERALGIYLSFFEQSIYSPEDGPQDDKQLRIIYKYLVFIAEKIRVYFRNRIGLSEEKKPLFDINLIAACLLINNIYISEIDLPTKTILKFHLDSSPLPLIDKVRKNLPILKMELVKFIKHVESSSEESNYHFEKLSDAYYYLKVIDEA